MSNRSQNPIRLNTSPSGPPPTSLTRLYLLDITSADQSAPACRSYILPRGSYGGYGHNDVIAAFDNADNNSLWADNPRGSWATGPFDIDLSTWNHEFRGEGTLVAVRMTDPAATFSDSTMAISAGNTAALADLYNLHVWPHSPNPIKYAWFSVKCRDGVDDVPYNLGASWYGTPKDIDPKVKNDGVAGIWGWFSWFRALFARP